MVGLLTGKSLAQVVCSFMKMGSGLENGGKGSPFPVMVFDPFMNGPCFKVKRFVHQAVPHHNISGLKKTLISPCGI
jgi:hypothetical protein